VGAQGGQGTARVPSGQKSDANSIKAPTVRMGVAPDTDEFAETMASMNDVLGLTDLESIDISRERPVTEAPTSHSDHLRIVAVILVVVGIIAAGIWRYSESGPSPEPSVDVEHVLLTGQIMGLMSAVESMIEGGSLEAARKTMDQTIAWAELGTLNVEAEAQRTTLLERLESVEKQREDLLSALRAGDCATVTKLHEDLLTHTPGLAQRLGRQARRCLTASASSVVEPAPVSAPAPSVNVQETPVKTPPPVVKTAPTLPPPVSIAPKPAVPKDDERGAEAVVEPVPVEASPDPTPVVEEETGLPPRTIAN